MPVQIEFETNAEDVVSSFNEMGDAVAWLEDVDASGLEELADVSTELAEGLEDASEAAEETAEALEDVEDATEKANKKGKTFREAMKEGKQIMGAFNMVMGLGKAALDGISDSAERLGRTELETALGNASEAGEDLIDTLTTMKLNLPILAAFGVEGRDAIAWVTDAADGLTNLANLVNISGIAIAQMTGNMSDSDAAARAAALMYEEVKVTTQQLTQAQIDLASPLDETNRLNREYKTEAELAAGASALAAQKAYDYQLALEKTTGPASDLAFAMGELNTQNLFTAASAGLSEDAQLQMAVAMGIVDQSVLDAKNRLDELREQYGVTGDAAKNGGADVDGYTSAVYRLNQELSGTLQWLRDVQAEMNSMPGGINGTVGGATGDGYDEATGTDGRWVGVPSGYPNDTFPVRMQSGEEFMVRQKGDTTTNNNWGGITVVLPGVTNAEQFYREMGRKAEMRSRV